MDYTPSTRSRFRVHLEHIVVMSAPLSDDDVLVEMARTNGKCRVSADTKGCYNLRTLPGRFASRSRNFDSDTSSYRNTLRFSGVVKGPFTACDDTNACTMDDHCVSEPNGDNARCIGRKYKTCLHVDFTQDETRNCQECDHKGGCTDQAGKFSGQDSDGNTVCGCFIGGQFYPHGSKNPANQCQMCNVAPPHSTTAWTDLVDYACENDDPCTLGSKCVVPPGGGDPVCQAESTFPCERAVCSRSATCIPNDRCQQQPLRWWPFSPSKLCAPSTDPCFADSYCQVGLSSCPSQVETQPVITGAGVDVRFSNLPHRVVPRSDYLYLTMDR